MKKLVTFRLDPELLSKAKGKADLENRTLTNFVETVLKRAVEGPVCSTEQSPDTAAGHRPHRRGVHRAGATD